MKTKLIGTALATVATVAAVGNFALFPAAENYLAPLVEEQLNNALHGRVQYESLDLNWTGGVSLKKLTVYDAKEELFLTSPEIKVGASLVGLGKMLLADGPALGIISSITVKDAELYLREYEDASWNISHLKKAKATTEEPSFKAEVFVENGKAHITTKEQSQFELTQIEGKFKGKENPLLSGALTTRFKGERLLVSGDYHTETADFSAYVETEKLDDSTLLQLVAKRANVDLTSGRLENTKLTVKRVAGLYDVQGQAELVDLAGHYNQYEVKEGTLPLHFTHNLMQVKAGTIKLNEQPIAIKGSVDIKDDTYPLNLELSGKALAVERLDQAFGLVGVADADVFVTGTIDKPKVEGFINEGNLSYDGYEVQKGQGHFIYEGQLLHVPSFSAQAFGGNIQGSGQYNLLKDTFEGDLKGDDLSLGEVPQVDASGNMTVSAHIEGEQKVITNVMATLHGEGISYKGVTADAFDADLIKEGEGYFIPRATAVMGSGAISAYGTLSDKELKLYYQGNAVPLSRFNEAFGVPVEGSLDVAGTVSGSMSQPVVWGTFAAQDGSLKEIPFKALSGEIKLENQSLSLARGYWQDSEGGHSLSGQLQLESKALDFTMETRHVRLENLAKPQGIDATGWLNNTMRITGTVDSPVVSGKAHMWDGSFKGELLSSVDADYHYDQDTLYVDDARAMAYGSLITGSGKMVGSALDFNFEGKRVALERFLRNLPGKLRGYANVKGSLTGTTDKPVFNGTIKGESLYANDTEIHGLDGLVYIDPEVINLQNLQFYQGQGLYEVKGGMRFDNHSIFGFASVKDGHIKNLINIVELPVSNIDGLLGGRVEFGGTLEAPDLSVVGKIHSVQVKDQAIGEGNVEMTLSHRKLNIKTLQLHVLDGLLAAQGEADLDGELKLQVASRDVPVEAILPITGKEIPLSGKLNFLANINGTMKDPLAETSITLSDASYNDVQFDSLYGLLNVKDGVVNINQGLVTKNIYKASAYGRIPLVSLYKEATPPKQGSGTMDVVFNFDDTELGILPMLTTYVKEGIGDTQGKVYLRGTYDKPLLEGSITVDNGLIRLAGVGKPLEAVKGKLSFAGESLTLQAEGLMGKGKATVNGRASWLNGTVQDYNLDIVMDKLDMQHAYYQGPLDVKLNVSHAGDYPALSGLVSINNATIDIPLSFETSEESMPMLLDVTIVAGDKVRLYNSLLYNMIVSGRAYFGGSTVYPRGEGGFIVNAGTVKYLSTPFKVSEGKVNFDSIHGFLPELVLKGNTRLQNYNVFVELTGPANQMALKLRSEPHLEERQIISLLTLKNGTRNTSQINSEDVNAFLTAGLEMTLFGGVESRLQNTLGLDLVSISTGSLDPYETTDKINQTYYNIEIGKYILPNLMVTMAKGVNNDLTMYGARYDLSSQLSLSGWVNNKNHSYVGGQWRFTF